MIGDDKPKVIRNFDLKGSNFHRHVKTTHEEFFAGCGLKTLKD
jgi:hypothetical protein